MSAATADEPDDHSDPARGPVQHHSATGNTICADGDCSRGNDSTSVGGSTVSVPECAGEEEELFEEMMKFMRGCFSEAKSDEHEVSKPVIVHRPKETHKPPERKTPRRFRPPPPLAPHETNTGSQEKAPFRRSLTHIEGVHGICARSLIPDEDGNHSGTPCEACLHLIEEAKKKPTSD